jgi:hypothetical protein
VGPDVLAAVWADAAAGIGAYQPPVTTDAPGAAAAAPPTPETVAGAPDWRGLLDLFEAHSGEDLATLWRESVVLPDEAALLDARTAARQSYARTLAIAGDWQLPRGIRDALRAWDFAAAEALMADARTVLAQRNAGAALAARSGLTLPVAMEPLFESGSLAEASAQAEAERAAIVAIEEAAGSRSSASDVLSGLGMLGENPERDLAASRRALTAGELDASREAADRAHRAWTAAWQEGRRRAMLAIAALVTLLVLGSAIMTHRRRTPGGRTSSSGGSRVARPADGARDDGTAPA